MHAKCAYFEKLSKHFDEFKLFKGHYILISKLRSFFVKKSTKFSLTRKSKLKGGTQATAIFQNWNHFSIKWTCFRYAYLGQVAYQDSVIAVALKVMLVKQIKCENWT